MGELQKKEEEMRQMFVQRVKEKEAELKEAEKEVESSHSSFWKQIPAFYSIPYKTFLFLLPLHSCMRSSTA